MADKLNRRYRLTIEIGDGKNVVITGPLTLEFTVSKTITASLNQGTFKIYNLSQATRTQIFQDRFRIKDKGSGKFYKQIILQAGYSNLSTIFRGNIKSSFPVRRGGDIIQEIDAYDGLYGSANSNSCVTLKKGITNQEVADRLVKDGKKLEKGVFSSISGSLERATAFFGNTVDSIRDYFKDKADVFIDDEKLFILDKNQAIGGQVLVISSETGLLGTPIRQQTYLEVEIMFESRIRLGQVVELKSSVNPTYDGRYKVQGVSHSGIISGAVAGPLKTMLQLNIGNDLANGLKIISAQ